MAITAQMRTEVSQLYVALFGRAPDGEGLGFWTQMRDSGKSMADIANIMFLTQPARVYYPTFLSNQEIIGAFYTNVLGRTADAEGLAFWTAKLNAQGASFGTVVAEMIAVVNAYSGTGEPSKSSHDLFVNRVQVAQYYGEHNGTVDGAKGALASVTKDPTTVTSLKLAIDNGVLPGIGQGAVFTLTVNQDHGAAFTGTTGNDTYSANAAQDGAGNLIQTLQDVDSVEAGDGFDVLNVTLSQPTTVSASLRHLEQVNVRFLALDANLNLVNSPEVVAAVVADSTTRGKISNINGLSSLTIRNQAQDVVIAGMAGTATTMALNFDNAGGAAGLNLDLGLDNASKVTTAKIATNNSRITIDSTIADKIKSAEVSVSGTNSLNFLDSVGSLEQLKVSGTGVMDFGFGVSFGKLKILDASAFSGALSAKFFTLNAIDVIGSSGNDFIKTSATAAGAGSRVALGAGNDVFVASLFGGFDRGLDGGEGTDILNYAGDNLTATTAKYVSNFEILDVSGQGFNYDLGLFAFSSVQADEAIGGALVADATFNNAPDAFALTVISKAKDGDFDLSNGKTVTVAGKDYAGTTANGNAETFTLKAVLNDGDGDGNPEGNIIVNGLTVANVEKLVFDVTVATLDSPGVSPAAHSLTVGNITAAQAETVVVQGNGSLLLQGLSNASQVSKIDAGTSAGNVTVDFSNHGLSVAYTGGSGQDSYFASKVGDTVWLGRGADSLFLNALSAHDVVVLKTGADSQIVDSNEDGKTNIAGDADAIDQILEFSTVDDRIDLTSFGFSGAQRGTVNVTAKMPALTTELVSIANFFNEAAIGNRGAAFAEVSGDGYLFVDANKDGNFTAADDLVIRLSGVADIGNAITF